MALQITPRAIASSATDRVKPIRGRAPESSVPNASHHALQIVLEARGEAIARQRKRLIGSIGREFLDHVLSWYKCDLERKLSDFQAYYNAGRVHAWLNGKTALKKRCPQF